MRKTRQKLLRQRRGFGVNPLLCSMFRPDDTFLCIYIHAYMCVLSASHTLSLVHLSPCLQPSTPFKQVSPLIHVNSQPCPRGSGIGQSNCPSMALILQWRQPEFASYIRVIIENPLSWSSCWVYYNIVSLWFLGRQHVITYRWCWVCCCLYSDHRACVVITKRYDWAVCIGSMWKMLVAFGMENQALKFL